MFVGIVFVFFVMREGFRFVMLDVVLWNFYYVYIYMCFVRLLVFWLSLKD